MGDHAVGLGNGRWSYTRPDKLDALTVRDGVQPVALSVGYGYPQRPAELAELADEAFRQHDYGPCAGTAYKHPCSGPGEPRARSSVGEALDLLDDVQGRLVAGVAGGILP